MSLIQFFKSKTFLKQLVFAFVGLLVFSFVVVKWLNISTNHDQKIEVPNLEKMSLRDVEKTLDEVYLNYVVIDSASFNPDYPANSVIEQSPDAGQFVKENRKIYLTLNSSKYPNVEIPELFGKTKRQAIAQLLAIGFRIDPNPIYVADIAEDVVRGLKFEGKEVKSGDKIPKNSIITLKLGDGNKGKGFSNSSEEAISEEIEF